MRAALQMAAIGESKGEVPVGAVLVRDNEVLARSFNQPIIRHDCTAHAEILALREAGEKTGNYRLPQCTLYVTLEPCAMCAMAMVHARIERLVFATADERTGAAGSVLNLLQQPEFNHRCEIESGVLQNEAVEMLQRFFKQRR